VDLHAQFGGVFPEVASRQHIRTVYPIVEAALQQAHLNLRDVDAIAVTRGPGLPGSLVVGVNVAKGLVLGSGLPLIGINHLEAHIYSAWLYTADAEPPTEPRFPLVVLVISGGHTELILMTDHLQYRRLGATLDDAAGEAFDKVAALLGLPYPGGPAIEQAALGGNRGAVRLPRAFLDEPDRLEFSFSGLKTAVRYLLYGQGKPVDRPPDLSSAQLADVAASFQEAVIDCLVAKAGSALRLTGLSTLCVAGGVAANARFGERLRQAAEGAPGFELQLAPRALCTDNAAMGAIAVERLRAGLVESLELDALPGLVRPGR
jgi:N6-L-threonylcarbamoyladenine synthase